MSTTTAPIVGINRHRLLRDGDGVTTLVAFHGCPLRCKYCLNPHCLSPDTPITHYDCQTLYQETRIDELYFLATNGGIAFGGGEPYLQSSFIAQFDSLCPHWKITIETSLNVDQRHIETLLPVIDQYIIDIKDTNSQIYKKYTDRDNAQVINNLQWLVDQGKSQQIIVRVPQIENFNTDRDIEQSVELLKGLGLQNFDLFTYKTDISKL